MRRDERREAGRRGERLAEEHLLRSGYRVLDRNFRTRAGELDLVAAVPGCLVFCEVRTRVGGGRDGAWAPGGPLESIGPRKRMRLRRVARDWLAATQRPSGRDRGSGRGLDRPEPRSAPAGAGSPRAAIRFDAIGVVVGPDGSLRSLEHVVDAF